MPPFADDQDERGAVSEWFSRHQRLLALLGVAGVLAGVGLVAAFLATQPRDEPRTPFAGTTRRVDLPVAAITGVPTTTPTASPSASPSPTAMATTTAPVASPSASPPAGGAPTAVPQPSPPATTAPPPRPPARPTREPRPTRTPTPTPPGEPSRPTPTPPSEDRHSLEIEIIGDRTFVAVGDENGPLMADRMRHGQRYSIGGEDYLRLYVEQRWAVRIIVDGQERPLRGDPNGRFSLIID